MKVQFNLITEFGDWNSNLIDINDISEYNNIVELSRKYYETGFEMETEDGSFIIFTPELVKKSVLRIIKS